MIIDNKKKHGCLQKYIFLALSCCDFVSCGLVFFSCLAKSIKHNDQAWQIYDTMWHLPIIGISGGIGNYIIVGVAIGRYSIFFFLSVSVKLIL